MDMNNITIKNSYLTQKIELRINGEEISQYSRLAALSNAYLKQYMENLISNLDNEVFDDYNIDFYGYKFMYELLCINAEKSEYCKEINYYSMDMAETPQNLMSELGKIAEVHNVKINKNLYATLYTNIIDVGVNDKEYIRKVDDLSADIGIFEDIDDVKCSKCKLCIIIDDRVLLDEENVITVPKESVDEVLEYYYIYNLFIPNFEKNIMALKYQNLSDKEKVLLDAIQKNSPRYYLGIIPDTIDLADVIDIDFDSFPADVYRIEFLGEGVLKQEENKWKAVTAGNVTISVIDKDNIVCESHDLKIIEHQYATSIKIIPRFGYLKVNERNYVDVVVVPADAEDRNELQYEISDNNIINYEDNQVIALKSGSAQIKIKGKKCEGILNIQVKSLLTQVYLNRTSITLRGGTSEILQCSVLPQDAETNHLVWELDNKNIAAINPSKDKLKCQVTTSKSFTGKGNIRCYDQTSGIGAICNIEVVSKIKHTWAGTLTLLCMLFGFFFPVLSGISIGLGIYGLVQDEEISHRPRYIVCMVISALTLIVWTGLLQ